MQLNTCYSPHQLMCFKLSVKRRRSIPSLAVSWCQLALINSAITTPRSYSSWWILPAARTHFRECQTIDLHKICVDLWSFGAQGHLSRPLKRLRMWRCSKGPCIIFSEEEVGKARIINHAVFHYRAPTQCWRRETAPLHFAITGMKGNLMDATWCKVHKVDTSDVRRDVCCDISILSNMTDQERSSSTAYLSRLFLVSSLHPDDGPFPALSPAVHRLSCRHAALIWNRLPGRGWLMRPGRCQTLTTQKKKKT